MEEKELSEKSTKEEVAEFFITKLNIKDDYANIFINEYISGDILPLMTEEEFKNVGFKFGPLKKIHRYIQANISKFKQIKINEKITFDSTNEEVKKFFKNHLNFNIESNDLSGKKLLILKEEDMQELGMKFGQRKRLINAQKQFLLNFKNIKSFSEFNIIFDKYNTKEINREFTFKINAMFEKLFYTTLDYQDNEYKNFFIIIDNILTINDNNKLDLSYICSIIGVNYELACKYYLYLVKNKDMKYIFDKLVGHVLSFFINNLPIDYSHYLLEFILIQCDSKLFIYSNIKIFNQMIFQENDFFQKGKNHKILCFQTLMNFIKIAGESILNNICQSSFVLGVFEMKSKINYDLKNNNIKFNKVSNLIDEDETFYEKILLVTDNENEAKTIYSKLKDDIKICKEKIVNIENILYYYSTFYPISKEEIIKIIKIKLSELQEKEIDKLKNIEINNYLNIKNFYFDEALEESKKLKYKYSSFFMSIYNNNNNIYKNKFSEDKIFKTSIKDYNNLLMQLTEKLKQNLSLFDINNIELIIEVIKNKKFNIKNEIDLIEEEYPSFKNNSDYIKNNFFNDLIDFSKKYEIVKFIEGIIQFIELNNKINENISSNYIEYFKAIYKLIISNKIDENNSKKIISSMKFNEYYSKSESYLKIIFRALFGKNESLLFLRKVKESIINNKTDNSFYNSKNINLFIDFYDLIKKLIDNKNIVKDEDFYKLFNIEKEKDKNIESILNEMNNLFFNYIKNNDINNMNIYSKEEKNNNIKKSQPKNKIINDVNNNLIQFQIQFNYNQNIINIQCNNLNEKMKDIFNKYATKSLINNLSSFYFIYGGQIINSESILSDILSNEDKNRNIMTILVNSNINPPTENSLIKSNFVICPKCKEPINLKIDNYKINLFGCKNNHNFNDILFKDYEKTQNIDLKKIICENCKEKNKFDSYKHEFYKCVTCSKNLCVLCKSTHDKNHIIFDYDKRYTLCLNHSESFCSYCKTCKKNLCINCEKKHLDHNIVSYGSILPDVEEAKINLNSLKKELDKFSKNITDIIKRLNILKENIEKYYTIFNNGIKIIENKNRNFEVINNINEIIKNDIYNDLCKINKENSIKNRIDLMFNIIDKIELNKKEKKDEITLIYNIDKNSDFIKIFDSEFVNNNKNNCKIIFKNKEYELSENLKINIEDNKEEKLEIKLKGVNSIINANRMFYKCEQLYSLPDINNWDISNVERINEMFFGCKQLKEIPNKFIKC